MNELSRHIESLLVSNDCVIVPGLGGFVTQYVTARRVDEENLYLPPYRTVGFNGQLTINDGLLVQAYMQSHDTNYPETVKLIEGTVSDVKRQLHEQGCYEFEGIGTLFLKLDGNYYFKPCEAGVLSPELYGLSSFTMMQISVQDERQTVKTNGWKLFVPDTSVSADVPRGKRTDYVFRINKSVVNYAVASVVAALFFCFFSLPTGVTPSAPVNEASLSKGMVFGLPTLEKAASAAMTDRQRLRLVTQKENKDREQMLCQPVPRKMIDPVKANKERKKYTIVLASAIPQKSAERYVGELHEQGVKQARVYVHHKMVRVVYDAYATEAEARDTLSALRGTRTCFDEAWIFCMPS